MRDLHVPLVCLIDFAGFRLFASCVLPISRDSLVTGTCDGGKTIFNKDDKMAELLAEAGKFLNLKGENRRADLHFS